MANSPKERSTTVRADLIEQLRRGPATAKDLSSAVGIPERDVAAHLEHIERSLHHGEDRFFRTRDRLTRPGACPQCRGTHIEAPRFLIERRES
jgi:predicted Zn-ribbon and HTH transcriptional regulator